MRAVRAITGMFLELVTAGTEVSGLFPASRVLLLAELGAGAALAQQLVRQFMEAVLARLIPQPLRVQRTQGAAVAQGAVAVRQEQVALVWSSSKFRLQKRLRSRQALPRLLRR